MSNARTAMPQTQLNVLRYPTDASTFTPASLFSLAPSMDHVPTPETQEAFFGVLQAQNPAFKATFKRFSSRAFKRLNLKEAEALLLSLVEEGFSADVLHLHLDWFCYTGRFAPFQTMGLWMQLFQIFRDKPLLLFGHELPSFLNHSLMVKERAIWKQWCEHFEATPQHRLVLHHPHHAMAWQAFGLPLESIRFLPKPMDAHKVPERYPIQPSLYALVKNRLQASVERPVQVIGVIPSDDDPTSLALLTDALTQMPEHIKCLVLGGSQAQRPQFKWEQDLLPLIQTKQLASRMVLTGEVHESEQHSYINACDLFYLCHRHHLDDFQRQIHGVLSEAKPVLVPAFSESVQGLHHLFPEAWRDTAVFKTGSVDAIREHILGVLNPRQAEFQKSFTPLLNAMSLEAVTLQYWQQYRSMNVLF